MDKLEVKDLSFSFGSQMILSRISFTIDSGEVLHLQGPNGSGKSTLLMILVGILAKDPNMLVTGPLSSSEREYLPSEDNCFFPKVSAIDNIAFWLSLRNRHISEADLRLELTSWGLGENALDRRMSIERFSKGMKRKLALARVVLSQTKLWILDEPTSGLDQKSIQIFEDKISQHLASGGMALVVSHERFSFAQKKNYHLG